jgi:hypothetical protein
VDQQAFRRAADAGAARLGVEHDPQRLLRIGGGVEVDVHDAFQMREDRHPRLALDKADEALAPARDDHVDMGHHPQHLRHRRAVAGGDKLDGVFRQARRAEAFHEAGVDRHRGMEALRPAAQDHRVSGLQAQGTCVGGHVRAALVDHPHDAERRAHPADVEARGHVPFGQHRAHGVGLVGHGAKAVRDPGDARGVEEEPVEHRGGQPLVAPVRHVLRVGRDDLARCASTASAAAWRAVRLASGAAKASSAAALSRARRCGHERVDVVCVLHRAASHGSGRQGKFRRDGSHSTMSSRWMSAARPG